MAKMSEYRNTGIPEGREQMAVQSRGWHGMVASTHGDPELDHLVCHRRLIGKRWWLKSAHTTVSSL
jgi:hypothetical protein